VRLECETALQVRKKLESYRTNKPMDSVVLQIRVAGGTQQRRWECQADIIQPLIYCAWQPPLRFIAYLD
jgi:hypothetical protein